MISTTRRDSDDSARTLFEPFRASDWLCLALMLLTACSLAHADVNPVDLVGCKRELSPFDKKKDGFVWKESDTKKNARGEKVAIALFPRKIAQRLTAKPFKFKSVAVWKDGKRFAKASFVYHWPEDKKPQRQVWRTEKAPKAFPKFSVLKADGNCFVLPDPSKRID